MEKVLNYIEENKDRHLEELVEFLKIKSISSDPAFSKDVKECADWVANNIRQAGFNEVKIIETPCHPLVYAEWLEAGDDKPTVLMYGHYDVQPVDPLELWDNPPFEPTIKDGYIFARGTADDKGQLFTHIKAFEAFFKTEGKLPCNVKIILEGEEEAAETHIEDFIADNKELLKCDLVVVSDTEWFAHGLPSICYGLRGISLCEVTVTGPNRDLHSGTFGGAVDNPIDVLAKMIARLKDEYGRVTVPGFYDDVKELSDEDRAEFLRLPHDEKEYCEDLEIFATRGEFGYSTLERTWIRPTLELNGMFGGYTGDGFKTVLPSKATAKISMRLVANQDAHDIANKVADYLRAIAPKTVKVDVKPFPGGNPVLVPKEGPAVRAAQAAFKKAFGKEPVFMLEGGSIPVVESFDSQLKAPTALLGLGLPSDNIHSPNENFSLDNYFGGIKTSAYFFDEIAKEGK